MIPASRITALLMLQVVLGGMAGIRAGAETIRVRADAPPGGDGARWETALRSLQDALAVVIAGDEIWLGKGSYTPDDGGGRTRGDLDAVFELVAGVAVYGGFSGDGHETARDQRDPQAHRTVLSGDMGGDDYAVFVFEDTDSIRGMNSRRIVRCVGAEDVTVDGVLIAGASNFETGGGMLVEDASPILRNVGFIGNRSSWGGGLAVLRGAPTIEGCRFVGNEAGFSGGGLYVAEGGTPEIRDCRILENSAGSSGGGVLLGQDSNATLVNCEILLNDAVVGGAASFSSCGGTLTGCALYFNSGGNVGRTLRFTNASPSLRNCTIAGSLSIVHRENAAPVYTNCILWRLSPYDVIHVANVDGGQAIFAHCLVGGSGGSAHWNPTFGTDGGSNLDADPKFYVPFEWGSNETRADLRLGFGSPAIDGGSAGAGVPALDLRGETRIVGERIDLGAYEFQIVDGDDDDKDGLSNAFESAHTNPSSATALAPEEDLDKDGLANLMEFALGRDPRRAEFQPPVTLTLEFFEEGERFYDIRGSYTRSLAAEPYVFLRAEISDRLGAPDWEWGYAYYLADRVSSPGGREIVHFGLNSPPYWAEEFCRLRVDSR